MTDRELLEIAAKAAGVELWPGCNYRAGKGIFCASVTWWNPLVDDGDALRLAVNLRIDLHCGDKDVTAWVQHPGDIIESDYFEEAEGDDKYAATRRAIVRAAYEIGQRINDQ